MKKKLIDITVDGHVHTRLCHHASGEMEEYVLAAVANGLKKLTFLEHFEVDINYFKTCWLIEDDFTYYLNEGDRLRKKYDGLLDIGLGTEVGFNPDHVREILDFLERYQWDRVGLSYHFLKINGMHFNMVGRKQSELKIFAEAGVERVITAYFSGLLTALEKIPASVVCHLDAVLRHHPQVFFSEEHHEQIRNILMLMKKKDIALEVNTSGFAFRNEPYPSRFILRQAKKMGIRFEAGSDAHRPQDVARYFKQLPEFLAVL